MSKSVNECFLRAEELDGAHMSGAVQLWASVLRRALVDQVLYSDPERKLSPEYAEIGDEVRNWVFGDGPENCEFSICSFDAVCGYVGLDAELVRERIENMTPDMIKRLRGMEFNDG